MKHSSKYLLTALISIMMALSACVLEDELKDSDQSLNPDDEIACTMEYAPVCAGEVEYGNSCLAKAAGVADYVEGKCESTQVCPALPEMAIECQQNYVTVPRWNLDTGCQELDECIHQDSLAQLCPVTGVRPPECNADQKLENVINEDGCIIGSKCVSVEPVVCTAIFFEAIDCLEGQIAEPVYSESGCQSGYKCVEPTIVSEPFPIDIPFDNCPVLSRMPSTCKSNEVEQAIIGQDGCTTRFKCVAK